MSDLARLPLFPLNTVLFPNMPLPLHVFEPRYKHMIRECLDNGTDFGVVLVLGGGVVKVGTSARIENVLQTFEDGRMNILTLGKDRFTIHNLIETGPYLSADVRFWEAEPEEEVADLFTLVKSSLKEYAQLTGKLSDTALFENYTPFSFSFFLAEINMYPLSLQQMVLEMTSTRARLERGYQSLVMLLNRLRLDQKLQKLLGTRQSFFNICN